MGASMRLRSSMTLSGALTALLLSGLPLAAAHGHSSHAMDMGKSGHNHTSSASIGINSYFSYPEHSAWMLAHIVLMTLAWVIVLPVGVFLSVARSRLAIPVRFGFLAVNAIGIFTSVIYDARTPDLYTNNSHHKIGWAVTWIAVVWIFLGIVSLLNDKSSQNGTWGQPVTSQGLAQHQTLQKYEPDDIARWSADSGVGTERNTASLCSSPRRHSVTDVRGEQHHDGQPGDGEDMHDEPLDDDEQHGLLNSGSDDRDLTGRLLRIRSERIMTAINILYVILERLQVFLAFLALTTGLVTWSGIFRGAGIYNGLAHWIKGAIFVWYGLLTLGRWMGAFADIGWAWNVRPEYPLVSRFASRIPSAEFTESFVMFLYGASNVFLEHLATWGKAWSAQDLEHVSITIMFFGGGLLGMLIENKRIRDLHNENTTFRKDDAIRHCGSVEAQKDEWETPKTYQTSLNPMPGLMILLLGIMMSSHHQSSMVSTMLHAQWGSLFVGFAIARAVTYILLYLKPPSSHFPSRPPSEIVASFCLVSGGLIFMGSTTDVVKLLERNELDAMSVFTVMMGLTALIMAWTTVLYGLKGWAAGRQRGMTA